MFIEALKFYLFIYFFKKTKKQQNKLKHEASQCKNKEEIQNTYIVHLENWNIFLTY